MSDLAVREVDSRRDLARFVDLPYRLHRGDPCWTPPLRRDVRKLLSPEHPFFLQAEAAWFLAERQGRVVGRAAAIENAAHNRFHGDRVGFFGFFECADDPEAARALLERSADWLSARGLEAMRGPVSPSTNGECGLVVAGGEHPPTLLTPHNPPYYAALLEGAGLHGVKDLYFWWHSTEGLPERLVRGTQAVARRQKVTQRALRKDRLADEIAIVRGLYASAWERNWGFVPMSDEELDQLAIDLRPILVPELFVFVEREGEPVAFAAAVPDFNQALRANPGGRLFPGILRILRASRRIRGVRILLMGIRPDQRNLGLDALMFHWIWTRAHALGYAWGEAGWVLEDNAAMNNGLMRLGFERYKTLRLYERAL
jgi:GNAT superfamily N-acetyltransferase